jgi:hypothetical protein
LFIFSGEEIKPSALSNDDDIKQSRTDSTPPTLISIPFITSDRSQQTTPFGMSLIDDESNVNDFTPTNNHHKRSVSEQRHSDNGSIKRSSSDEHTSVLPNDDEEESPHEIKSITTTALIKQSRQTPKIKYLDKTPTSSRSMIIKNGKSSSLKWSTSLNTCKYFLLFD